MLKAKKQMESCNGKGLTALRTILLLLDLIIIVYSVTTLSKDVTEADTENFDWGGGSSGAP